MSYDKGHRESGVFDFEHGVGYLTEEQERRLAWIISVFVLLISSPVFILAFMVIGEF